MVISMKIDESLAQGLPIVDAPDGCSINTIPEGQYTLIYDQYEGVYLRVPGGIKTYNNKKSQIWVTQVGDEPIDTFYDPSTGETVPLYEYKAVSVIDEGKLLTFDNPNQALPKNLEEFEQFCSVMQYIAEESVKNIDDPEIASAVNENYANVFARKDDLIEDYKDADTAELLALNAAEEEITRYLANHYPDTYAYLTRGAMLRCPHGSHRRRLGLLRDHAFYTNDKPLIHQMDCIVGDDKNIRTFGVCSSPYISGPTVLLEGVTYDADGKPIPTGKNVKGCACQPVMMCPWQEPHTETMITQEGSLNIYPSVTTKSWLYCIYSSEGEIIPVTSGQEYSDEEQAE